jgi:hypothetical protein
MSVSAKLLLLAAAIGADVKLLSAAQGDLTALPTTAKDNLVAAIAEVHALAESGGSGVVIDDAAGNGATTVVWSADKVFDTIEVAKQAVKDDLLNGAGPAFDTFQELQVLLENNEDAVTALTSAVGNRVRYDAVQALTPEQRQQARENIGAVGQSELDAVNNLATSIGDAIGDSDADLVAAYNAAKA